MSIEIANEPKIVVGPNTKIETLKERFVELLKEGKSNDEIIKELEIHGTECEVYARVVGFFRPLKNWNVGKQEEFKDRKEFIIK